MQVDMYVYTCKPSSCGLDKQAYHMRRCVLTARASNGTAEHNAHSRESLSPHPLGQAHCSFYLLIFTLWSYIFFASLCLNLLNSSRVHLSVAILIATHLKYSQPLTLSFIPSHSLPPFLSLGAHCTQECIKLALYLFCQLAASALPAMPSIWDTIDLKRKQ